jgi:hypothetical protein
MFLHFLNSRVHSDDVLNGSTLLPKEGGPIKTFVLRGGLKTLPHISMMAACSHWRMSWNFLMSLEGRI